MTPADKALRFFRAAESHAETQLSFQKQDPKGYQEQFEKVLDSLKGSGTGTSRKRQQEELVDRVKSNALTNRKLNKRQKTTGVDRPIALSDLVAYKVLLKSKPPPR